MYSYAARLSKLNVPSLELRRFILNSLCVTKLYSASYRCEIWWLCPL